MTYHKNNVISSNAFLKIISSPAISSWTHFWIEHFDPSNDRRNARHVVKIKPSKCDVASVDLDDPDVFVPSAKILMSYTPR